MDTAQNYCLRNLQDGYVFSSRCCSRLVLGASPGGAGGLPKTPSIVTCYVRVDYVITKPCAEVFICRISTQHLIRPNFFSYSQQNTVKFSTSAPRRNPVPKFFIPIFLIVCIKLYFRRDPGMRYRVIQELPHIYVIVLRKSMSFLLFFQPAICEWTLLTFSWNHTNIKISSRQVTNPFISRSGCVECARARSDDFHLSKAAFVRAVFSPGFSLLLRMAVKSVPLLQAFYFQRHRQHVWT